MFAELITYLRNSWIWPGISEVGQFIGTHLISGMLPAFLIAGGIAVFLDKQRITRLMGAKASPFVSFPVAAFSGALLTVCSCGVVPIFSGILTRGAGIGPAFTFLFSAPAINLIALTYTFSLLGWKVAFGRVVSVLFCALVIGISMRYIFRHQEEAIDVPVVMIEDDSDRTDLQTFVFFALMVLVMLTSTGFFDSITDKLFQNALSRPFPKLILLLFESLIVISVLKKWFHPEEVRQWLEKSWSLFNMIFPKVLFGIFVSGLLAAVFPMSRFMSWFDNNTIVANLLISTIGAISYFGTIVGVNVTSTMIHFGMNMGPAMAFLLSGPSVSLPEIFALIPIMGRDKAIIYLLIVILTTSISGLVFGMFY
ncbi:MAG: permease [Candidatus Riflebacteria bacterium]|nr:permease [Candidatus Riflebacteria bacterium]